MNHFYSKTTALRGIGTNLNKDICIKYVWKKYIYKCTLTSTNKPILFSLFWLLTAFFYAFTIVVFLCGYMNHVAVLIKCVPNKLPCIGRILLIF